uniref:Uncharacterized protein n=1 Tax=Panagrellus redivivus TaxID=6233 RepID=A0A7E4ZWQ6_PANRE
MTSSQLCVRTRTRNRVSVRASLSGAFEHHQLHPATVPTSAPLDPSQRAATSGLIHTRILKLQKLSVVSKMLTLLIISHPGTIALTLAVSERFYIFASIPR